MDLNRERAAATWTKSTRSGSNGGECVPERWAWDSKGPSAGPDIGVRGPILIA
jgi:Domain of unknown function (DUF397)